MDTKQIESIVEATLSQDAFWQVNKKIAQALHSIEAAVLLADLISKKKYFESKGQLEDGWFFNTKDNIMFDLSMGRRGVERARKILRSANLIEVKKVGLPAKNFYRINYPAIMEILGQSVRIVPTGETNLVPPAEPNCTGNKNKVIKIKDNNIIPPTIEMVRDYVTSKNLPVDPEQFFDFYESKAWMIGKNKMKDWQAAIRTWMRHQKERSAYQRPETAEEKRKREYNEWFRKEFGRDAYGIEGEV